MAQTDRIQRAAGRPRGYGQSTMPRSLLTHWRAAAGALTLAGVLAGALFLPVPMLADGGRDAVHREDLFRIRNGLRVRANHRLDGPAAGSRGRGAVALCP